MPLKKLAQDFKSSGAGENQTRIVGEESRDHMQPLHQRIDYGGFLRKLKSKCNLRFYIFHEKLIVSLLWIIIM